jgi:anthranilate phosphoribosyltransferase
MLDGRVSDLELGAVLLAYRLKGETAEELAAMLSAAHASFAPLVVAEGAYRPVSIPSYNGARKQPNLVPLLALLLAREGVPTLVHGVGTDPGRVTSAEIFAALNRPEARDHAEIEAQLAAGRVAFSSIETLAPKLARLLSMRRRMGVRNSTHTLVKLLQPFAEPGLRLVNYTHPPYRESLSALFAAHPEAAVGGALLARGTEGEAVADTRRQVQVDWLHDGICETLVEPEHRRRPPGSTPCCAAKRRCRVRSRARSRRSSASRSADDRTRNTSPKPLKAMRGGRPARSATSASARFVGHLHASSRGQSANSLLTHASALIYIGQMRSYPNTLRITLGRLSALSLRLA